MRDGALISLLDGATRGNDVKVPTAGPGDGGILSLGNGADGDSGTAAGSGPGGDGKLLALGNGGDGGLPGPGHGGDGGLIDLLNGVGGGRAVLPADQARLATSGGDGGAVRILDDRSGMDAADSGGDGIRRHDPHRAARRHTRSPFPLLERGRRRGRPAHAAQRRHGRGRRR